MLICLRETWPGGVVFETLNCSGLCNSAFLYLLSCHRLRHLTQAPASVCLQLRAEHRPCQAASAPAWWFDTCMTPCSGWETQQSHRRELKDLYLSLCCSCFSPWAWCELFQRSKGGKNALVNKPALFSGRGVGSKLKPQPAHSRVPCNQVVINICAVLSDSASLQPSVELVSII